MKTTHFNRMKDEDESWKSALSNACDSKNLIKNVTVTIKRKQQAPANDRTQCVLLRTHM